MCVRKVRGCVCAFAFLRVSRVRGCVGLGFQLSLPGLFRGLVCEYVVVFWQSQLFRILITPPVDCQVYIVCVRRVRGLSFEYVIVYVVRVSGCLVRGYLLSFPGLLYCVCQESSWASV